MKIFSTFAVGLAVVALPQQVAADDVPAYETGAAIEESGDGNSSFLQNTWAEWWAQAKFPDWLDITKVSPVTTVAWLMSSPGAFVQGQLKISDTQLQVLQTNLGPVGRGLIKVTTVDGKTVVDPQMLHIALCSVTVPVLTWITYRLLKPLVYGKTKAEVKEMERKADEIAEDMLVPEPGRSWYRPWTWLRRGNTQTKEAPKETVARQSSPNGNGATTQSEATTQPDQKQESEEPSKNIVADVAEMPRSEPIEGVQTPAAAASMGQQGTSGVSLDENQSNASTKGEATDGNKGTNEENGNEDKVDPEKTSFWNKGMITAVVCGSVALIVGVIVFLARCNSSDSKMGSRMEDSDSDEERAPALASGAGPTSGQSNPRSGSQ